MAYASLGVIYDEFISFKGGKLIYYSRSNLNSRKKQYAKLPLTASEKLIANQRRIKNRMSDALTKLYETASDKLVTIAKSKKQFMFKCTFITLTVNACFKSHQDVINKQCLPKILDWFRYINKNLLYVWKKELTKQGTIHYHIITNSFIHHRRIRDKWNSILYKHQLTTSLDANSTDIHSLKHIDKPLNYMLKYITKTSESDKDIQGKIWDCSSELKKPSKVVIVNPEKPLINEIDSYIKAGNELKQYDYCSIVKISLSKLFYYPQLLDYYKKWLFQHLPYSERPPDLSFVV